MFKKVKTVINLFARGVSEGTNTNIKEGIRFSARQFVIFIIVATVVSGVASVINGRE